MADIIPNLVVSMPSQLFTMARSFKGLANGEIYIGLVDTDPTIPSNQIQVYLSNEDGTYTPVAQPIITNMAGYPVYSGQIAKFVTVQNYSMAVYDSYGTLQFYYKDIAKYDPDQLRTEFEQFIVNLAAKDGFKYIGSCKNVTELRSTEPTTDKQLINLLQYNDNTGYGGGFLFYDSSDISSPDDGVIIFVTSGGKRWKRVNSDKVNLIDAGAIKSTDATDPLTRLVNACKGGVVRIPRGEFIASGILLSGSTYNNTRFECEGTILLKQRASSSDNNFGGAYVGIIIKDAFNISGNIKMNGRRTLQPNEEHIYCIGIAGGGDINLNVDIQEVRGDGIYVSQSDWLSNSTITNGLILTGSVENSALDGRNAVSIISANDINVRMRYRNVGGVVNSTQQPGGIDFEPNFDYQTITNGVVEVTAVNCNYGVCILGKSYNVKNIAIKASLSSCNPFLSRWRDCDIDIGVDSSSFAGNLDTCIGGNVRIRHTNCQNGFDVGWRGEVTNCNVSIIGDLWTNYVGRTGKIKGGSLRWEAYNCVSGGTGIALRIDTPQDGAAYTIVGTTFSCCVPYDSVVQYAARNAGGLITFSQCGLGNSNLATWSNWGAAVSGQLANVRDSNTVICNGFSTSTAQPGVGYYVAGDFVKANTFTIASGKVQLGWLRITTGSAHVAGTDWTPFFGTTS